VRKLLTPNTYCWSQSEWHLLTKKRTTEHSSLWDAFNSNVTMFIVHKWCHSNVNV